MDNIQNESSIEGFEEYVLSLNMSEDFDEFDDYEENSAKKVTEENRDDFSEKVNVELAELLEADPDLVIDDESEEIIDDEVDERVLDDIDKAACPSGTLLQRASGNKDILIDRTRPELPVMKTANPTPQDKCRMMWAEICNKGAMLRFTAAIEVCSSKVGTVPETVQYLLKSFPILKKYKFDDAMFTMLCDLIPDVAEAWGFGEFGDEIGDRYMLSLAKKVATDNYKMGELTVGDLHKYAQMRDVLEGIKVRQQLTDLKCKQLALENQPSGNSTTKVIFNLERRDGNG